MSATVVVKIMDPEYIAGETVKGTVTAFVDQVDRLHFLSAAKVVVTVAGVEHASCCTEDNHTTSTATATATTTSKKSAPKSVHEKASRVFWKCTPLVFDGAVGAGVHTWPFSAVLPKDLPSNMMVSPQEDGMFSVSYRATASFSFDKVVPICSASDEAEILVWSNPVPYLSTPPVTVTPHKTQNVEGARGRTKRGSVSMGFRLNQTAFGRGEGIRVSVACLNTGPATSNIESVTVELVQEETWSTNTSSKDGTPVASSCHEEVLASETIAGAEDVAQSGLLSETKKKRGVVAGMIRKAPLLGALPRFSSSSSSSARKTDVRNMLGSGKGASFVVGVPTETLDTVAATSGGGGGGQGGEGGEKQGSTQSPRYLKLISSLRHFVRVTVRAEDTSGSSSQVVSMQHPVRVLHHLAGAEKEPVVAVALTNVPLCYAPADYLRGVFVGHDRSPLPMAYGVPAM